MNNPYDEYYYQVFHELKKNLDNKWGNVTPQQHPEHQFIEELQNILSNEPGNKLQVDKDTTFNEIYRQLDPTLQELRTKYKLHENPPGTNSELIMFRTRLQVEWKKVNIIDKPRPDPVTLLRSGLESLFNNNEKYTYPTGKVIYYTRGTKAIPRIKRDILQEFDLLNKPPVLYKAKFMLSQVESRFT